MNFVLLLFLCLLCTECNSKINEVPAKSATDNITIPTEIIINYLQQYFSCDGFFISILLSSSNNEQRKLQDDFINELVLHPRFMTFSYNILNRVDPSRLGNKNNFNLAFVDEGASLE